MIQYQRPGPEGSPLVPVAYRFLEPVQLRLRRPDGTIVLCGYGIGDQVQVLEPVDKYLINCTRLRNEIPLADDSFIITVPADLRMERVFATENSNADLR